MRSEDEIKARIYRWNKVTLSEFQQEPVATAMCELRWVLGDNFDIIQANNEARNWPYKAKPNIG